MRGAHIPEEALRKAYLLDRLSIAKCAERFGCSENKIWRLLRKYRIQTRGRESFKKFLKIPKTALRKAYLGEKKTLRECGELFGTSATVIGKALRFYGIPVRKGGPIQGRNYLRRKKIELPGLAELLEEGYGVRDIAFLLGADETLVRKRLKSLGLFVPKRKPTRFIDWGERCPRCGILFDSELFSKAASGVCAACESEMISENEKKIQGKEEKKLREEDFLPLSPLELLKTWRELLSKLPPAEAEKLRKEWLDATRKKLEPAERGLLSKIQRRLKIKGLGKVSTLLLVAQLGILFIEFDYKGRGG